MHVHTIIDFVHSYFENCCTFAYLLPERFREEGSCFYGAGVCFQGTCAYFHGEATCLYGEHVTLMGHRTIQLERHEKLSVLNKDVPLSRPGRRNCTETAGILYIRVIRRPQSQIPLGYQLFLCLTIKPRSHCTR